jgi:hypothetical protein
MINKIHISNWLKGSRNIDLKKELQDLLLTNFVESIKNNNPNLEIVYLCTEEAYNDSPLIVKNNVTVKNIPDSFNDMPSHQWPIVKLKTIANAEEEEIFHLDFDIIWKYNLSNVFNILENEQIDCLFQCFELLDDTHSYYTSYLKKYPFVQDFLAKVNNKVAYNAGVSFYNKKAKLRLKTIIETYYESDFVFSDCCGFEQVLIPNLLISEGYNVQTLSNLLPKLPLVSNNINLSQLKDETAEFYKGFSKCGTFLSNINFYHFLGDCKKSDDIFEVINFINGWENLT